MVGVRPGLPERDSAEEERRDPPPPELMAVPEMVEEVTHFTTVNLWAL